MYDSQAKQLIADLGIERMKFAFEWYAGKEIPGHRNIFGLSTTHEDGITTIIQVACGNGYRRAMRTLAHELRHSWQRFLGIYIIEVDRNKTEWCIWRGSKFVKPAKWKAFDAVKMVNKDFDRYAAQAHEVDARAYAEDAWLRLFKDNKPKRREPPRSISKLDDFFL